jgi:hypothetical protein
VLQNVELQNIELQNAEFQNIELQNAELQNAELQNVESYRTSNLTKHQNTKRRILQNDEIQNVDNTKRRKPLTRLSGLIMNSGHRKRTTAIPCTYIIYYPVPKFYMVFTCERVFIALPILYITTIDNMKNILITFFTVGDVLDDFPDSPGPPMRFSGEDASRLLDADDHAMDSTAAAHLCASEQPGGSKRQLSESPSTASRATPAADGPNLPPIYNSILRRKLAKNSIRHLDGSVINDNPGTPLGAAVSPFGPIGSFANKGDKRHNMSVHRHDHASLRNISTSFDPNTLQCKACQGGHQVLRRTIEGSDVGLDNPPLFVLADQNFPPIVPVGGEG